MSEWQKTILTSLQTMLHAHFGTVELYEEETPAFLRLTPPLFTDGTGEVYMEICLLPYSDEITVAQIYSTILPDVPETIQQKLPEWNLKSLIGAYGRYETQLYHKYNLALLNDIPPEDHIENLFAGICTAMDEMARRLPEALELLTETEPKK